jgi:hypothetical protein
MENVNDNTPAIDAVRIFYQLADVSSWSLQGQSAMPLYQAFQD